MRSRRGDKTYGEYPIDGNFKSLANGEQIDEGPEKAGDKGRCRDEEEPARRGYPRWRGACHAYDSKCLK